MKYIALSLALIISVVKAESTYCWSEKLGYPCCPEEITQPNYKDSEGDCNGEWCGIRNGRCWSRAGGYPCCEGGESIALIDQDGIWGQNANGNWCGFRERKQRWVDRELIKDTRDEWNAFKKVWSNEYKENFERLSVFVGEDETMLNFGWYSTTKNEVPTICWGTDENLNDCKEFIGTSEKHYKVSGIQYYSNKVSVTGLERNSVYYYKRKLNGQWEKPIQFKTYNPDNFKFIFVGDPQIGGSHDRYSISNLYERVLTVDEGTANDAFNWNRTITHSFDFVKEPSLLLSAGDQADEENNSFYSDQEHYNEETQYSALLLPKQIQTIPMAAAIGNHDRNTENFRHHFNVPNPYKNPSYLMDDGWIEGYNYYFKYNNVLIVVLNTNHEECVDFESVITNAVEKYPDTLWRIALFHHDIYGNGVTHSLEDGMKNVLRPCLTKLLSNFKFDLAISGHDHVYTASKFITYDANANNSGKYVTSDIQTNETFKDPKGTFFITANCSSGSKLYSFVEDTPDFVHEDIQSFTSTFGTLDFTKEYGKATLKIVTYDVESPDTIIDGPYIIEKTIVETEPEPGQEPEPENKVNKEFIYIYSMFIR
ncbi:Metallo-dependent phosphatase [Piromyces finnis]|uniref:Purple acid phosphatase n=1 Tax=Piromyces finnis TaxID=1754191 RepID=A0A1Y1VL52_9FUNG|nr:Metallo-dependent phosphatase [Piromyces finnis]|eukprot:ORX59197.1 Metallo-dependent phosphatase [Piromyces finnis]